MGHFVLSVFLIVLAVTAPACAQVDKHAQLRVLAQDLAITIEATADRLHAQGVEGYVPGSRNREDIGRTTATLQQLSTAAAPTTAQVASAGFVLGSLAENAPEIYAAIMSDPAMLARIHFAEKNLGMKVFVPPELVSQGMQLLIDLAEFLKIKAASASPAGDKNQPADDGHEEWDINLKDLKEVEQHLVADNLANRYFAARLANFIYQTHGELYSKEIVPDDTLVKRSMAYMLEADSLAYAYYQMHADHDGPPGLLGALGAMYLDKYCPGTENLGFSCFTVMTQMAFAYSRLHEPAKYKAMLQRLDQALGQHQRLRLAVSPPKKMSAADAENRKKTLLELWRYLPGSDALAGKGSEHWQTDAMETSIAALRHAEMVSYWIARAAGRNFPFLPRAIADARNEELSEAKWAAVLLAAAQIGAMELADYDLALTAIKGIRELYLTLAATQEVTIDPIQFSVLELRTLYAANRLESARKLAREIRKHPSYRQPQHAGGSAPFVILASCDSAAGFEPNQVTASFLTTEQYTLSKIDMLIALKSGQRIKMAAVRPIIEYEAQALIAAASSPGAEGQDAPPSAFVAGWLEYSKILATDKAEQERLARAAKCLLARPGIIRRLAIDFVNKGSQERQTLNAAVFTLLMDSGTFERDGAEIDNEDFMLLQAASIMQAQNGISAAAARSVFSSAGTRKAIQHTELGMEKFSDQLDNAGGPFDIAKQLRALRTGGEQALQQLLAVMQDSPAEFFKYAQLKNQNLINLPSIKEYLEADEALMLLTVFDRKLVSLVVRRDSSRIRSLDLPRQAVKSAVAELRTSINVLSQKSSSLPPDYRADLAWQLYRQLIEPVETSLVGATTVYLVAGEDLALLPFAALVTDAPPAQAVVDFSKYRQLRWLGDRYAFISLPSVYAMLKNGISLGEPQPAKLLGVGDPAVASEVLANLRLAPMPDTGSLLGRVGKPIDLPPLLGATASYAGLLAVTSGEALSDADMMLINSHALPAGGIVQYGVLEPAILLAPTKVADGVDFLDPARVMSLKLSLRLIMLLACETAGGRTIENAQPYAGLVNSFFFAGAGSVVATNLPIDPAVAEEFAVRFLHYVRDERMPNARALQMATADIRCANDTLACAAGDKFVWAHPAYWSHFTLVGSGR